uniref:K-box domain-containing protein n=1 Tax=Aegilops tauschii TaxID=37682 RepID=N1QYT7_AEGTA
MWGLGKEEDRRKESAGMNEIIDKYSTHSKNLGKSDQQPAIDLNLEHCKYDSLNEQLAEASLRLRLRSVPILDLCDLLEVVNYKAAEILTDRQFMQQISDLQQKGTQLAEENMRLKNQMHEVPTVSTVAVAEAENVVPEDAHSSDSVMTAVYSGSSQDNDDGSDISLKLA